MVNKGDSLVGSDLPPVLIVVLNFIVGIWVEGLGYILIGCQERGMWHLIISVILAVCNFIGFYILVVPGIIILIIRIALLIISTLDLMKMTERIENGEDVGEYEIHTVPLTARIPHW